MRSADRASQPRGRIVAALAGPAARAVATVLAASTAWPCAAEVIPPHRPGLSCAGRRTPEAAVICGDGVLLRFHLSNEATEADAGRRHPAEAVAARDRERDALAACGGDRECLRGVLARHAQDLTLMLSR